MSSRLVGEGCHGVPLAMPTEKLWITIAAHFDGDEFTPEQLEKSPVFSLLLSSLKTKAK
ncbi:MAG: hypothetical protein ACLR1V_09855 [Coprococcus sp.]